MNIGPRTGAALVAHEPQFIEVTLGAEDDAAFAAGQTDIAAVMDGQLEEARQALVQKIGENIGVRRIALVSADSGVVGAYVHGNNRIAVLVGLSGGDQELARDVAMHVAAVNPQVISPDDMPEEVIAKEKEIYTAQAQDSGKPAEIIEKMIGGRIKKFLAENSLSEQAFVKDPDVTVGKLVTRSGAEITRFVRFEVGEVVVRDHVEEEAEVAGHARGLAGSLEVGRPRLPEPRDPVDQVGCVIPHQRARRRVAEEVPEEGSEQAVVGLAGPVSQEEGPSREDRVELAQRIQVEIGASVSEGGGEDNVYRMATGFVF